MSELRRVLFPARRIAVRRTAEQQKQESQTLKGTLKRIRAAEDRSQALRAALKTLGLNTPLKTKIVIWTLIAFVFVLVVPVF